MDKSSIWTVGSGTLTISAASALITGTYGAIRGHQQTGLLVGATALNSAITAATFFSAREFVVSPVLTRVIPWPEYARRRRELGLESQSTSIPDPTLSDLRLEKLLDSGLSGTFTGGLIRGVKSGPRGILPGSILGGALCVLLQYGYNQCNIARLRYISNRNAEGPTAVNKPAFTSRYEDTDHAPESSPSIVQHLLKSIGFIPISDEEHIAKLKKTRGIYLNRIAELELQVEEEKLAREISREAEP